MTVTSAARVGTDYAFGLEAATSWSVVNQGSVAGATGIFLSGGGSVSNAATGNISGGTGVDMGNAAGSGSVENAGNIAGSNIGIQLVLGGTISNASGGKITGGNEGVQAEIGATTVENAGTISGGAFGVQIIDGGTVFNASGATITGTREFGVLVASGAATVENAGTISGGFNYSVLFGSAGDLLIVDAGAEFTGKVRATGSGNTIELTSAAGAGAISGLGTQYIGFQTITIDSGASWIVGGSVSGFAGVAIGGFNPNDALDLTNVAYASGETVALNRSTDVLTVKNAGGTSLGTVQLSGAFTPQNQFTVASDGAGGSTVTETVGPLSRISGTYSSGIVLTGGSYTNPVTVTATGAVSGSAIGLSAATYWTVVNEGSVSGTTYGIYLKAGGYLSNATGGTISGHGKTVYLRDGGLVSNAAGGLITTAVGYGVYVTNAIGTVDNAGSINGTVYMQAGGSVTNISGGTISSTGNSIWIANVSGTVNNSGVITSPNTGVVLNDGGAITNAASGIITGNGDGVYVSGASATVTNAGTIGGGTYSVMFDVAGSTLIVDAGAVFHGAVGGIQGGDTLDFAGVSFSASDKVSVSASNLLTVGNAGGTKLATLQLSASVKGDHFRLSADAGGTGTDVKVLSLTSQIGGTYSSGIALISANYTNPVTVTSTGSIATGSGNALSAATAWTVDNAGHISASGTSGKGIYIAAGGLVSNASGATVTGGKDGVSLKVAGTVENAGTISGGTYSVQFAAGGDRLIVDAGAKFTGKAKAAGTGNTIELKSAAGAGAISGLGSQYVGFQTVTIDSGASWTVGGSASGFAGETIGGFNPHDALDLTNVAFASGETAALNQTTDVLTVKNAGGKALGTVQLSGVFPPRAQFMVTSDGASGIKVTETVVPASQLAGAYSSGIVLTSASYTNPVTVTSTGVVGNAAGAGIYAASAWTVYNDGGTVAAANGSGIALAAGGTVQNSGSVTGSNAGVLIQGNTGAVVNTGYIDGAGSSGVLETLGGTVTNTTPGTITGGNGVSLEGQPGTLDNAGGITGTAADGVYLGEGGSVDNSGAIQGRNVGVYFRVAAATLQNSGYIAGPDGYGVQLNGGGAVSNAPGGTITGFRDGVNVQNAAGTVENSGSIDSNFGNGVGLGYGGYLTNASGGTITGGGSGVGVYNAVGTVENSGRIGGIQGNGVNLGDGGTVENAGSIKGFFGVQFSNGGTLTNALGGTITGGYAGIGVDNAAGTVANAGSIGGAYNYGVFLRDGGAVTNAAGGTITGGYDGVIAKYAAGSVYNSGSIGGTDRFGVQLDTGGAVTNAVGGTITGGIDGVYVSGASGQVTNAGTITGGTDAVYLKGGGTLLVDQSAVFDGNVAANGIGNTLELAASASAGTLSGLGGKYTGFQTVTIDTGAVWTVGGTQSGFNGETIDGLTGRDSLDITDLAFVAGDTSATLSGGVLAVTDGGSTVDITLGTADPQRFFVHNDGNGGVLVNDVRPRPSSQITGTYTSGVVLTSALYTSPVTVTGTGTVSNTGGTGIYAATEWTIDNAGSINGRNGIDLEQGGYLSNAAGGSITGTGGGHSGDNGVALYGSGTVVNAGFIYGYGGFSRYGVRLEDGGKVVNEFTGTISSNYGGVMLDHVAGTVDNAGSISGGVQLRAGGLVTNEITGTITGYYAVIIKNTAATVINAGYIRAYGAKAGILVTTSGSTVENSGTITGKSGVYVENGAGTVVNAGSIGGTNNDGAMLKDGGTVSNATAGAITGGVGVYVSNAAGTVENAGSISGGGSYGVVLGAGGYLSNAAGGTIFGGAYGVNGGPAAVTVKNAGSIVGGAFTGVETSGAASVSNASTGTITGGENGLLLRAGGTVNNAGRIGGTAQYGIRLENGGTVSNAAGGTITGGVDGVFGHYGAATVTNAGTIGGGTYSVLFGATGSTLIVDAGAVFHGAVGGIQGGDTLDFAGVSFSASDKVSVSASNLLTVGNAGGTKLATLQLSASVKGDHFQLSADAGGTGTDVKVVSLTSQIGGTYSSGIALISANYTNPVTVTSTGSIATGSGNAITAATAWTVGNAGHISASGTSGNGVYIAAGGLVSNASGATITGGKDGVSLKGAGTVENAGTISGGTYSVQFAAGGDRLIVDAGAQFTGKAKAAGTGNMIELKSAASAGTLSGLGSQYVGFQTVTIDSGAAWTVSGNLSGFGGVTIGGFNTYDTLDLTNVAFASGETATLNRNTDVLAMKNAGGKALGTVQLNGAFTPQDQFKVVSDGASGIKITEAVAPASQLIGAYSSGIVLTGANYTNPVTVTSTGSIATIGGNAISAATAWTADNAGHISASGASGNGIYLAAGGRVSNASGATITGGNDGMLLEGAGTVENAGTITGGAYSLRFAAGGDRLIVDPGAKFTGAAKAAGTGNTIELKWAASAGTLSGLGSQYTGFQTVTIDNSATWTVAGSVSGFGGVTIGGFTKRDTLDLTNAAYAPGETATLNRTTDVLTVRSAGGTALGTAQLSGTFPAQAQFQVASDGASGINITETAVLPQISNAYPSGIVLNTANYTNPVTVAATGTVNSSSGTGLYAATTWTIQNNGEVSGYAGILLHDGGGVTNESNGRINGSQSGVNLRGLAGTVNNYGTITATGTSGSGIVLASGGTVDNSGSITGTGAEGTGVYLKSGGAVTNLSGGTISGGYHGVQVIGAAGTVTNSGSITEIASTNAAVDLLAGGSITNTSGGTIRGGRCGIYLSAGGSVTNLLGGTISGQNNGGIIASGYGSINNSGAITSTGTAADGAFLKSGGAVTNLSGGTISGSVSGVLITGGAGKVENAGTISGQIDAVDLAGTLSSRLIVDAGAVFTGKVVANASVTNTIELTATTVAGAPNVFSAAFSGFQSLVFDAGAAWTVSGQAAELKAATIGGFGQGDTIDLTNVAFGATAKGSFAGGVLTVKTGAATSATLTFAGSAANPVFALASDGHGGTDITLASGTAATPALADRQIALFAEAIAGHSSSLWALGENSALHRVNEGDIGGIMAPPLR